MFELTSNDVSFLPSLVGIHRFIFIFASSTQKIASQISVYSADDCGTWLNGFNKQYRLTNPKTSMNLMSLNRKAVYSLQRCPKIPLLSTARNLSLLLNPDAVTSTYCSLLEGAHAGCSHFTARYQTPQWCCLRGALFTNVFGNDKLSSQFTQKNKY